MGFDFEQGLKGAGGGALAGGGLGGPLGALVGGGVGLLSGFFGGPSEDEQQNRQMLMDYYNQVGNRQAPQAGPASQSATSGFRANQSGLISRLEAMANGQGPSLAKQQFQQATDRNVRSQQAIAASGRGGPLAQLTAANNTAMLGANAAQGSALARTNEQMGAIGQLGGVINQGRMSDENNSQFNANQTNQMAIQNLDARLRAMGMDDQARLQILSQMGGQAANQQGRVGMGDQMLAGGAGLFSQAATQNAGKARGMSPIAAGNPGAGGYYTPSPQPMPYPSSPFSLNQFERAGGVGNR